MAQLGARPTTTNTAAATIVGLTVVVLAAISALHVAWGRRSTFPFPTRVRLNDAVIGSQVTPSPAACYGVAAGLAGAAVAVTAAQLRGTKSSRVASGGVGLVLALRAVFGWKGWTEVVVPGSNSATFKRLDRRYYSPLCALLAIGASVAAGRPRPS